MPKKGRQSKQEKLQARQKKAGGAEGDEASAGLVWGLRAAMGLVVAFGVLTSGAFDWVFTWLASVPLQTVRNAAAEGEWAPERLAEAAVAAAATHPTVSGGVAVMLVLAPVFSLPKMIAVRPAAKSTWSSGTVFGWCRSATATQ